MSFSTTTIPYNGTVFAIDNRAIPKVVLLPTVSTNPGRLLIFKDYYGNAARSTITISTTGTDLLEDINWTTSMRSSFMTVSLLSDGLRSWRFTGLYNGLLTPNDTRGIFNFTTFSAANFYTAGNTTFVGGEARITSNGVGLAGSMYYNDKLNIQSFTTNFTMRFEVTNADGGFFIIQNQSSNALGGAGGDLGWIGVTPSVGIRFDSWNGSSGQFSTDVLSNGTLPSGQGASGVLNTSLGLTAGGTWNFYVTVSYNGTTLSYTITNTANGSNFSSNATINIPSIVGASTAWVGFTGATGGATEFQYISSWSFTN